MKADARNDNEKRLFIFSASILIVLQKEVLKCCINTKIADNYCEYCVRSFTHLDYDCGTMAKDQIGLDKNGMH